MTTFQEDPCLGSSGEKHMTPLSVAASCTSQRCPRSWDVRTTSHRARKQPRHRAKVFFGTERRLRGAREKKLVSKRMAPHELG